ncbi:hypothetical protein [Pasteurella dagmatis]|uniref:Uncharacterized protein n=1 Tax=Pasteurella dagmatis ATCC 43325 TaxID=667128 RepID=C9PSH4_9PAST|nr:hypothetical protein [Pasteurella dagmatis]EEX49495.1 hypothetical protein HMPREF0621_1948 [Pasteurella dagmatis ATCC 43325]SNV82891.1 Uncharacterised protein [Pasteurella dagmatis]
MLFLKSTYSVNETVQLLNEYFSVETFKTKDILDLFFEGSLNFSLRCSFFRAEDEECFLSINGESKEIFCNISIYGIPSKKESISVSDSYAEIFVNSVDCFVGEGLFNILPEGSKYIKDEGGEPFSIYIKQLGFIEYANTDVYPNKYRNRVGIVNVLFEEGGVVANISSVVIESKSLLDCIEILQHRNKSINYRLGSSSDKSLVDKLQTENVELKSENKNLQEYITVLENENQSLRDSNQILSAVEYAGDIPIRTDKDKLAYTFKLIIQKSDFITKNDGKYPTYSELHTMLKTTYRNQHIPSKNTLRKYLEP